MLFYVDAGQLERILQQTNKHTDKKFPIFQLGRRRLGILSALMMGVSITGLGIYSLLDEQGKTTQSVAWIPLPCLCVYVLGKITKLYSYEYL